jgi:hypothetical protein
MSAASLRELLRATERIAEDEQTLSAATLAELRALHARLGAFEGTAKPAARRAAVEHFIAQTRLLLGPGRHALYLSTLERELVSILLGAPEDAALERGL